MGTVLLCDICNEPVCEKDNQWDCPKCGAVCSIDTLWKWKNSYGDSPITLSTIPEHSHVIKRKGKPLSILSKEMYESLCLWRDHIYICDGVDEDSDEGFLAMLTSRTEAINKTLNILRKIEDEKNEL